MLKGEHHENTIILMEVGELLHKKKKSEIGIPTIREINNR